MRGAESIPKTEGAMISLPFRHLLDFKVGGHIATIHIAHRVGLHQHVVKSCVENGLLFVGALNINAAEFALPNVVGGLDIFVEVPTFGLGLHIFPCPFVVNGRDGDFHRQFLTIGRVKAECRAKHAAVDHIAVTHIESAIHQQMLVERPRELGVEINLTQFCPSANDAISFNGVVVDETDLGLNDIVVTAA